VAAIAVSVLIFSVAGAQLVRLGEANFHFMPPEIAVNSPANGATCTSSDVSISIKVITHGSYPYAPTFAYCRLDGENSINMTFVETSGLWFANGTFNNLSQAWHYLTADVHIMSFTKEESTYTVYSAFYVDLSTPPPTPTPSPTLLPTVSILFPLNNSLFNAGVGGVNFGLIYETNSSLSWVGYSLDGAANVTITGNSTLVHQIVSSNGNHTLTIFANDTSGNWATPQTVTYHVNAYPDITFYPDYTPTPSPSPSTQIDISWVGEAKQLAQGYQPYTDDSAPEVTLSFCNMYKVENGTRQLIYYGNGDALSTYLGELLSNATVNMGNISEDQLGKVLTNNAVLILTYRASILATQFPEAKYYQGCFILEDKLNEGLQGTIIARGLITSDLALLGVTIPSPSPTSSPSVAEFPNWIVLPLIAVTAMVLVYFKKRKRS
jgi:hypothetical protein